MGDTVGGAGDPGEQLESDGGRDEVLRPYGEKKIYVDRPVGPEHPESDQYPEHRPRCSHSRRNLSEHWCHKEIRIPAPTPQRR